MWCRALATTCCSRRPSTWRAACCASSRGPEPFDARSWSMKTEAGSEVLAASLGAAAARAPERPSSLGVWWLAARPKTLLAAATPVWVGSACAAAAGSFRWPPALAALVGAMLLQVAANFANDVFDYEKGADTEARLGPTRAVAAGWLTPAAMRRGLYIVIGLALLVCAYLVS